MKRLHLPGCVGRTGEVIRFEVRDDTPFDTDIAVIEHGRHHRRHGIDIVTCLHEHGVARRQFNIISNRRAAGRI